MEPEAYRDTFAAEAGHWYFDGLQRLILRTVARFQRLKGPLRILDAGCGTGGLLSRLLPAEQACGVDISPEALRYCRMRNLKTIARASVERLPFPAEVFDLVVSIDVLYHRLVNDDASALSEFYRVLKPQGQLILNLPAHSWLLSDFDKFVHARLRYRKSDLENAVRGSGFRLLFSTYRNSLLFPLVVVSRKAFKTRTAQGIEPAGAAVNAVLKAVLGLENYLLRFTPLPFGSSIWIVAMKNST